ncbi:MAG: hypothetical protein ACJAXK_001173 [Yoonia sp.]|jgi:hypothetical protein
MTKMFDMTHAPQPVYNPQQHAAPTQAEAANPLFPLTPNQVRELLS